MISHSIFAFSFTFLIGFAFSLPTNSSHSKLKIAGGEPADIKDFPHQVALRLGDAICGGAILNKRYILSAAHCTYDIDVSLMSARTGSIYRNVGGVEIPVEALYQHEKFNPDTFDYDIVLLKLKADIVFNENIKPIDVVPADFVIEENRLATVTGYGALAAKGPLAKSLQKVDLPLITTETCLQIYGDEYITERMFCAGYVEGGKDACPGDSGGAIILEGKIVGIVSFGPECAAPNLPGIYTKASEFRNFIDTIIGN